MEADSRLLFEQARARVGRHLPGVVDGFTARPAASAHDAAATAAARPVAAAVR
jgi:hypothetical protein